MYCFQNFLSLKEIDRHEKDNKKAQIDQQKGQFCLHKF